MPARWLVVSVCLFGCVSTPPPHPRALEANELCAIALAQDDLTRADVQCDLGIQFSPQYADLWVNKGLIALRRGQTELAKEHFIKALRFNQEQAQAYNNLGYIYLGDRQLGKAHDNFQRALKVNPDYTEARYNLAITYYRMGDRMEAAKKELRTIVAINPNLADPHHYLGIIALEEKRLQEATAELQRAVALSPGYADAWASLGATHAEAGRFVEAKEAYVSCLEADPNHAQCRQAVPIMERKALLLEPSLKEAKENAEAENTPAALFALARSYHEKGLRAEEERAYHRCLKLDNKYPPCHFGLHELFAADRRDRDALTACKNFLKFAVVEEFPQQVDSCEKYVMANAR